MDGNPKSIYNNIKQQQQSLLEQHCLQYNPEEDVFSKAQLKSAELATNLHLGVEIFGRLLRSLGLASTWSSATTSRRATTAPVTWMIASVRLSCRYLQRYSDGPGNLSAISNNNGVFCRGNARSEAGGGCEARWVDDDFNLHGTLWRR